MRMRFICSKCKDSHAIYADDIFEGIALIENQGWSITRSQAGGVDQALCLNCCTEIQDAQLKIYEAEMEQQLTDYKDCYQ